MVRCMGNPSLRNDDEVLGVSYLPYLSYVGKPHPGRNIERVPENDLCLRMFWKKVSQSL